MQQLDALVKEQEEANRLRRETGLDAETFAVYWVLRTEHPDQALGLAREIGEVRRRYPNAASNAEEFRQLKTDIYKVLVPVVTGAPLIKLADRVLALVRAK
jgi:hypothetical protein